MIETSFKSKVVGYAERHGNKTASREFTAPEAIVKKKQFHTTSKYSISKPYPVSALLVGLERWCGVTLLSFLQ